MKRRNWALLVLLTVGLTCFILSRTVWGPPTEASAGEHTMDAAPSADLTESERRYIQDQPHHWRQVVIKQH